LTNKPNAHNLSDDDDDEDFDEPLNLNRVIKTKRRNNFESTEASNLSTQQHKLAPKLAPKENFTKKQKV